MLTTAQFRIFCPPHLHCKNVNIKISSIILDECETWSFTLKEEHRLKVLENRVLREIFGPKKEEAGETA
jgi:hypothetical protein